MTEVIKIERNGVEADIVDRYLGEFLKDGWTQVGKRTEEIPEEGDIEDSKIDEEWISDKINASESKDEIESLVNEFYGVDIDKRGSLETVKEKALAVINEGGRSNS